MKTNELMQGDWLFYRGRMDAFPFKVEQITRRKIGYHAEPNENRMYYLRPWECFPIPLTEKFLQRNFTDPLELVWFPLDTKPGFFAIYKYQSFNGDVFRLNIQYVHELQHILKLYNINKEIEL